MRELNRDVTRAVAAQEPDVGQLSGKSSRASRRRLIFAGVLLGLGLGGLFDGIVLHQILQWHHMVSEPVPPTSVGDLEFNTLADGLFHAFAWAVTVAGIFTLVSSNGGLHAVGAVRTVIGGALAGWGLFNLVEGIVDHHLLGLHHVRPGPDALGYDLGFLAWGGLMLATGVALMRRGTATQPRVSRDATGADAP